MLASLQRRCCCETERASSRRTAEGVGDAYICSGARRLTEEPCCFSASKKSGVRAPPMATASRNDQRARERRALVDAQVGTRELF